MQVAKGGTLHHSEERKGLVAVVTSSSSTPRNCLWNTARMTVVIIHRQYTHMNYSKTIE